MKTTFMLILLFGFGYLAPFGCNRSKLSKTPKSSEVVSANKQLCLFGPIVIIKDTKPHA